MNYRAMLRKRYLVLLVPVLLGIGYLWLHFGAPTRIALVNYQEFQVAELHQANDSRFIQLEHLSLDGLTEQRLSRYDLLLFFGRGLNLSPEQDEAVRRAQRRGTRVFVNGATSPDSDVTDLAGESREALSDYVTQGGRRNLHSMLDYVRREVGGKRLFAPVPEPLVEVPRESLFHLGEEQVFADYEAYSTYYAAAGLEKEGAPRVALITSIVGPRSADRAHVDALITRLEAEGLNVVPIGGFTRRLEFLKAADPDLVIYLPHGRLVPGKADDVLVWLQEQQVPVLAPLELLEEATTWRTGQEGMGGGMLTQSIVMPELDGAIEPFVVSAQVPDAMGLNTFGVLPDRLDTLVSRVSRWLTLQRKANSEKRVAIVYLKGPGQNAMVAGGMEVAPSLFNVLKRLEAAGYNTEGLPADAAAFEADIQARGPVLGPYAKGAFDDFVKEDDPELILAESYEAWCRSALPAELYAAVEGAYGPAPGAYLSTVKDGQSMLALPRVQYGNVVLLPQLLPGLGEDAGKLVHGADVAPPHPYLATYLWARKGFEADVLMHFGTHGSLEFTPFRQNALSPKDWADALVGDLPHLYVYVINNIGEAIIAKRRSYATIVSHLTPPFTDSELYGPLLAMQESAGAYGETEDEGLRAALAESLRTGLDETGLHVDLDIPWPLERELTEEEVGQIHTYLFSLAQEKITQGLYTLGEAYGPDRVADTVRMMHVDTIAHARHRLDHRNGLAPKELPPEEFEVAYRVPAQETIDQLLSGAAVPEDFLDGADEARRVRWEQRGRAASHDEVFASMLALGDAKPNKGGGEGPLNEAEQARLESLALAAALVDKQREFLLGLEDDTSFERSAGVLQPDGMKNMRRMASVIPPMKAALEALEGPGMLELLALMHRPGGREAVLAILADDAVQEQIRMEREKQEATQVAQLVTEGARAILLSASKPDEFSERVATLALEEVLHYQKILSGYEKHQGLADQVSAADTPDAEAIAAVMRASDQVIVPALTVLNARKEALDAEEEEYVRAVQQLREGLHHAAAGKEALSQSPGSEMDGVLAGLSGQYIAPSSGGDPIGNPNAIPTGRNLYAIDAERTPSPEAWRLGMATADALIAKKLADTGEVPAKVALTVWGGDFIKTQGMDMAVIFRLLGVEPVRNARGVVHDVRLTPIEALGRPRVDVVVQTSGQLRDVAASRLFLIDKAVQLASAADDGDIFNAVAEGTRLAEQHMKAEGLSPRDARTFATARVFGGVNGNYGTGIMGLVESSDRWETEDAIGAQYLENMGAVYTEAHWGHFQPGVFSGALQGTDTLLHPRGSSVDGPLSLDHVYEFMGGLNAAIGHATGVDPEGYFSDTRNLTRPELVGATEAIWRESRTTLLNPKFITALQEGGASSAEVFAETFRNTFGWNATKASVIDPSLWDRLNEVYVEDIHELDMRAYFEEKNPYAYQEMSAVMLETVRKGYWTPDEETIARIAELHVSLVQNHSPGCSGFVCDNGALRDFIADRVAPELAESYQEAIESIRTGSAADAVEGVRLEKEEQMPQPVRELLVTRGTAWAGVLVLLAAGALVAVGYVRRRRVE